jgi:esterase/lipase
MAKTNELISESEACYQFLPKLSEDYAFDVIRMENLIAVYNNEAKPIKTIIHTLKKALNDYPKTSSKEMAIRRFDDEYYFLAWEQKKYNDPRYNEINQHETANANPEPFLLQPETANGTGILLVHGLLARPAEVRGYGEFLCKQGYVVLGPRLEGHGTSPHALRDQTWEDWYDSIFRCLQILKQHCEKIVLIGFSSGGALTLNLAAENHPEVKAVVAISVPIKFINRTFMLVPLLHGTNKLVKWVSSFEGVKPFIENVPEHPGINYRNMPVRSMYELRRLIQTLDKVLPQVQIPALIIHADQDPVVAVESAKTIIEELGSENKQLKIVNANHHGILKDNSGDTWAIIDQFLKQLGAPSFNTETSLSSSNNLVKLQDYR